jgi:hypothetical protein
MSEDATPLIQPATPGWWKRKSKKSKVFLIALALIVGLVAISIAAGGSSTQSNPNAAGSAGTDASGSDASAPAEVAPIVHGTWKSDCNQYSAGDFSACKAVKVSDVTCQWQDNNVHMSAAFENTFAAHVTMHMQPTYNLLNAGLHGNGFDSVKDVGLDAGETRTVTVDENPAGVDTHPRITSCRPGVDALQGVELG